MSVSYAVATERSSFEPTFGDRHTMRLCSLNIKGLCSLLLFLFLYCDGQVRLPDTRSFLEVSVGRGTTVFEVQPSFRSVVIGLATGGKAMDFRICSEEV